MSSKVRVVIYSQSKDMERLTLYSESKGYRIVEIFDKPADNNGILLLELMDYIIDSHVDKLIVLSCTTLSMDAAELIMFINGLCDAGISVMVYDNNLETLLPTGEINPSFRLILDVLYEFDTIKKRTTRERLEKSYTRFRENGGQVGRKSGYRKSKLQYKREYWRELDLLRNGQSLKKCHRETRTSVNTLRKLKSMFL